MVSYTEMLENIAQIHPNLVKINDKANDTSKVLHSPSHFPFHVHKEEFERLHK